MIYKVDTTHTVRNGKGEEFTGKVIKIFHHVGDGLFLSGKIKGRSRKARLAICNLDKYGWVNITSGVTDEELVETLTDDLKVAVRSSSGPKGLFIS